MQWQVLTAHIKTALDRADWSSPLRLQRLEGGEEEQKKREVPSTAQRGNGAAGVDEDPTRLEASSLQA